MLARLDVSQLPDALVARLAAGENPISVLAPVLQASELPVLEARWTRGVSVTGVSGSQVGGHLRPGVSTWRIWEGGLTRPCGRVCIERRVRALVPS